MAGQFGFGKTLERSENFHWLHKSYDVKTYVYGSQICQQKKDSRAKHSGVPPLLMFLSAIDDRLLQASF